MEPLPRELTKAIEGSISVGPGNLTDFRVNGILVYGYVEWKKFCVFDASYGGLICDGELKARFTEQDNWSASVMNNHGTVLNRLNIAKIGGETSYC